MQVLSTIILSQIVSAIFLLFLQRKNRYPNKVLIGVLLAYGFWMIDILLRVSHTYRDHPNLYFIPINYSLSFGPLIYFYIRTLTNDGFRLGRESLKHFLPVFAQMLFYCVCFALPYSLKRSFWINVHSLYTYDLEIILVQLSLIFYLLRSIRYFRQYRVYVANRFSESSHINLNWLRLVIFLLLALAVIWLVDFLGWIIFRQVRF
ncbi:MAG: hypothetical protein AAFZ52_15015, partial [Bacteroidota bacterium]